MLCSKQSNTILDILKTINTHEERHFTLTGALFLTGYNNTNLQTCKELKILSNLEIPLIEKSGLFNDDLTVFGKTLTTYGKIASPIHSSNIDNCAQNMVGRKGFEPSNPAMSRRYLNQARPPAR